MKIKHNKKRNTAFVFESLIKEMTVAILKEDRERKEKTLAVIRKHFPPGSILHRHLQCYRSLYENQNLTKEVCEKILREAKLASRVLDAEGLFTSQTDLINDVNKEIEPRVFHNFVPNYKTLATIDQIFSSKLSPKNTVILETQLINNMMNSSGEPKSDQIIDNLIVNAFINKFNTKYDTTLLENQKFLLTHYISSFCDNGLALKVFLNEEIARLKLRIVEALSCAEIKSDTTMTEKTHKVVEKLESFKTFNITEDVVLTILKAQQLEQEIFENGD